MIGPFAAISGMFSNPSSLMQFDQPAVSINSDQIRSRAQQDQRYSPLGYYSNFSLFMDGFISVIGTPAYDTINHVPSTAADTVQRPFDLLGTDWERTAPVRTDVQAFAAVPFTIGEMKFSFGAGATRYADLSYYFRNNNVLSPSVLAPEAFVRTRPINDADSSSRAVQWYQHTLQRDGSIRSYGFSAAAALSGEFSAGISVQLLDGSSDDREQRWERGRLRFYQNYFRAESVYYRVDRNGTSEYSGTEVTLSAEWHIRAVTFGASVNLPTLIERSYSYAETVDTTGTSRTTRGNGKDKISLPARGRAGLSIRLAEHLDVALEYAYHPYAEAEYTPSSGPKHHPWLSSGDIMFGARYTIASYLVLRAGAQERSEVFEVTGNPLPGDVVNSSVYSLGAGFSMMGAAIDVGYQYQKMKYIDAWVGALSINTVTAHTVNASLTYGIPW
jgi:hypothetical protein